MKQIKRITIMVLVLSLCASSFAFAASYKTLKYDDVMAIAAKNHESLTMPNELYDADMSQYYQTDSGLLTQEEINALRTEKSKIKKLTKEQAIEDADLFFRAWKYAYPSYYFIGEDSFLSAREEVMETLNKLSGSVSGQKFGDILYDSMNFLQDAHSEIDERSPIYIEDSLKHEYYFDRSIIFSQDSNGYYINYDDGKWYYSKASNKNLRIEPSVLKSGKVVYSPILHIAKEKAPKSSTITLKKGSKTKKIKVKWTMAADVTRQGAIQKQCETYSQDGIYYINYITMRSEVGDVNDFINTAHEAKKHNAVIFDLRKTQGHEHWQLEDWIEAFTGETPAANKILFSRSNALRSLRNYPTFEIAPIGSERTKIQLTKGKPVSNDVTLIILTDSSCGSSVESALNLLSTVENSIVIGANSTGCQQGGSGQTYYLPNSGVSFTFGGFMKFTRKLKNIDGIGFEPDLWCDPKIALSATVDMLKRYDYIDSDGAEKMKQKIDPVAVDMRVLWGNSKIKPTQCFGDITSRGDYISITANGKKIKDFTVKSGAKDYLLANKLDDGRIRLKTLKSYKGEIYPFTVTYKGVDYTFYTNDPSMQ